MRGRGAREEVDAMEAPASASDKGSRPQTPLSRTIVAGLGCLVAAASATGALVLIVTEASRPVGPTDVMAPVAAAVLAGVGALVVVRGHDTRYGWLLVASGVAVGVVRVTGEYSLHAERSGDPGLPFVTAAGWIQDLWMVFFLLIFLLLPALFPDGTAASPRWRRRVMVTAAAWVTLIVVFALTERPMSNAFEEVPDPPTNPTGVLPVPEGAINLVWVLVTLASIVVGLGSLVSRWRVADVELRQRFKWVLYAFGLVLASAAIDLLYGVSEETSAVDLAGLSWVVSLLVAASMVGLVVSLGLAVLRFRLFDVDLVINRTLVYGALSVIVVAAYVTVVAGVGALLPVDDLVLSLVTTGIVAVAFAPLRTRLQRWVNRLMFGQRDDPYAVLSEMGRLLARSGVPQQTLRALARTIAAALKLPGVAVELEEDGSWRRWAVDGRVPEGEGVVVPVEHQGERVGRLVVMPRSARESLTSADRRLLEDIAHQAGALAASVRLTGALQRSREGLVKAREEERRRIRRDLHDGLGPSLAAQTFRLDAVLARLGDDPGAATDLVEELKRENRELVADVRRLVHDLRPPALDELGLAGALSAHARQHERAGLSVAVETDPTPLPPLPAAVEVAAYRIAREAITNVARHADADRCSASLEVMDGRLSVAVADDGVGVEGSVFPGVGLLSMRERAEELGGTFEVMPASPTGTRVRATLPLATAAANGIGADHD